MRGAIVAVALLAAMPTRGWSQSNPQLVDAVRMAQEGHGDSARAMVSKLLETTAPTDTLYPEILYAGAMVANDGGEMRTRLQRVVVEYGASAWSDDALLRLAQMDYATRNFSSASRNLERIRSDYPATPLLPQAAYWAARTYFDQNDPAQACRWLADGLAQSQGNVELANQLGYLNQRCSAPPGGVASGTPSDTSTTRPPSDSSSASSRGAASSTPSTKPGAPRTRYRVQIAAVATEAAADAAARNARALGLTVVTVHDRKLYKVRAGRYATRAEAQAAAAGLKVKLGGTPFVVAEP